MDEYREILTLRQKRKKKKYLHWPLVILSLAIAYLAWCTVRPLGGASINVLPSIDLTSSKVVELPWPAGSQGAIGTTDIGIIENSHADESTLPTASIAKLITAMTVLKKYPLLPGQQGPTLTLTRADVDIYNNYLARHGSLVGVAAGEKISEYQALEAMLIPSGNNMADSLAIWAFGSLENYRKAAQNEVMLLKMNNTEIGSDASGLDPDTKSTPTDLIKLGQAVLTNPILAGIVSKQDASVPVAGTIYNTNKLLGQNSVIGIKTGNSDQAGGCLLFAANYNFSPTRQTTIIGVVQHAADIDAALKSVPPLLAATKNNLTIQHPVEARQTVAILKLPWTSAIPLRTASDISMPLWSGSNPVRSVQVDDLGAPNFFSGNFKTVLDNQSIGSLSESFGNLTKTVDLVPDRTVASPSLVWRLAHPL